MVPPTQKDNWSLLLRKLTGPFCSESYLDIPSQKANWSLLIRKLTGHS